jgi:glycosyltransferase involved in cell wall biosynthesis
VACSFGPGSDQAAEIIVPSEATRSDLLRQHALEPARITVIPHDVDHDRFRSAPPEEIDRARLRYRLDGLYLLFVGGIEPRKNLPGLLRAYARLPCPPPRRW